MRNAKVQAKLHGPGSRSLVSSRQVILLRDAKLSVLERTERASGRAKSLQVVRPHQTQIPPSVKDGRFPFDWDGITLLAPGTFPPAKERRVQVSPASSSCLAGTTILHGSPRWRRGKVFSKKKNRRAAARTPQEERRGGVPRRRQALGGPRARGWVGRSE